MHAYSTPDGDILVNFSDTNDLDVGSIEAAKACTQAIEFLLSYPPRIKLDDQAVRAVSILTEAGACLHPDFFLTGRGAAMNSLIPQQFLMTTMFGFSFIERLTPLGLFALAERRGGYWKGHLERNIYRVLAAISMMIVGADHLDQLPLTLVSDVIGHFRTAGGLRWREGLLTSEQVAVSVFAEVTKALGAHFQDEALTAQARQTRLSHSNGATWEAFKSNPTPLQRELYEFWELYSEDSLSNPLVEKQVVMDVGKIISDHGHESVLEAFSVPFPLNCFVDFVKQRRGDLPKGALGSVRTAKRFTDFIVSELRDDHPKKVFFPMVTEKEVMFTSNAVGDRGRSKLHESNAGALPERYLFLFKQILSEGAAGWPGRTFTRPVLHEGSLKDVYCPVLPTLLLALALIPLRGAQLRRFDSGEGDLRVFNGISLTWETNTHPNAGYWAKIQKAKRNETRGYAYEFTDTSPTLTGFSINTNKTGEPYKIPWMSPELHKILWELAQWQREYGGVQRPLGPEDYIDDKAKTSKSRLESLPEIFPLFRLPPTKMNPLAGQVVSAGMLHKAMLAVLLELEKRWNALNPDDPVTIITAYNVAGQPQKAIYSVHGLRVRGITDLYLAGVPIEIISKIVAGHATVAMTLYYLRFDPAKLDKILDTRMMESTSAAMSSFIDDFKNMKIAEARRRTTYIDAGTVEQIEALDTSLFCNVDIGVCPYSGERCGDGGALAKSNSKAGGDLHHPVPGGARNCIMCRHLVSGTPFILPLELFGSQLLWKRNECGKQLAEHRGRLEDLRRRHNNREILPEQYRVQLDRLRAENQTLKDRIEQIDAAVFRVNVHLTAATKILKDDLAAGRTPGVALIASDVSSATEYIERTPFEMASLITRASRFWSILRDDKLEQTQRRYLDHVMFNAGEAPISLRADLSEAQRDEAGTLLTSFLMQRVSSEDRQNLVEGKTNLKQLNVEAEVRRLMDNVVLQEMPTSTRPSAQIALLEDN